VEHPKWVDRMGQWSANTLASGFYAGACVAALAGNLALGLACVTVASCCVAARRYLS
jgi:hypothetical protein